MGDADATRAMAELAASNRELANAIKAIGKNGAAMPRVILMGMDESGVPAPLQMSGGMLKMQLITSGVGKLLGQGTLTGGLATLFTAPIAYPKVTLSLNNIYDDSVAEYLTAAAYFVKSGGTADTAQAKNAKIYSGESEVIRFVGLTQGDTIQALCNLAGGVTWQLWAEQ